MLRTNLAQVGENPITNPSLIVLILIMLIPAASILTVMMFHFLSKEMHRISTLNKFRLDIRSNIVHLVGYKRAYINLEHKYGRDNLFLSVVPKTPYGLDAHTYDSISEGVRGFNSYKSQAQSITDYTQAPVMLTVFMYGNIKEFEDGFRSEKQRVLNAELDSTVTFICSNCDQVSTEIVYVDMVSLATGEHNLGHSMVCHQCVRWFTGKYIFPLIGKLHFRLASLYWNGKLAKPEYITIDEYFKSLIREKGYDKFLSSISENDLTDAPIS